jgi:hypothetical protein
VEDLDAGVNEGFDTRLQRESLLGLPASTGADRLKAGLQLLERNAPT